MKKNLWRLIFLCCFIVLLPHISIARPSISELESRLEGLENKLDSNLNFEISSKVEFLQKEIQELRGIIEEQQHLIYKLTKGDHLKSESNVANNINPTSLSASPAVAATAPTTSKKQLQPEQAAYNAAYKLIEDKNFSERI